MSYIGSVPGLRNGVAAPSGYMGTQTIQNLGSNTTLPNNSGVVVSLINLSLSPGVYIISPHLQIVLQGNGGFNFGEINYGISTSSTSFDNIGFTQCTSVSTFSTDTFTTNTNAVQRFVSINVTTSYYLIVQGVNMSSYGYNQFYANTNTCLIATRIS